MIGLIVFCIILVVALLIVTGRGLQTNRECADLNNLLCDERIKNAEMAAPYQRLIDELGERCFDINVENTNLRQFEKLYNEALKKISDLEFQISAKENMVMEATKLEMSWERAQTEIERYRQMENAYKEAEAVRKTLSEKLGLGHTATWASFHGVMSRCFDLFGILKDLRL